MNQNSNTRCTYYISFFFCYKQFTAFCHKNKRHWKTTNTSWLRDMKCSAFLKNRNDWLCHIKHQPMRDPWSIKKNLSAIPELYGISRSNLCSTDWTYVCSKCILYWLHYKEHTIYFRWCWLSANFNHILLSDSPDSRVIIREAQYMDIKDMC